MLTCDPYNILNEINLRSIGLKGIVIKLNLCKH